MYVHTSCVGYFFGCHDFITENNSSPFQDFPLHHKTLLHPHPHHMPSFYITFPFLYSSSNPLPFLSLSHSTFLSHIPYHLLLLFISATQHIVTSHPLFCPALSQVCNHPDLFEPRPITSPFVDSGISYSPGILVTEAVSVLSCDVLLWNIWNLERNNCK